MGQSQTSAATGSVHSECMPPDAARLRCTAASANNQWELATEIDPDPLKTPFFLAMRTKQCVGVVLVLDKDATPFRRIWWYACNPNLTLNPKP